MVTWGALDGWRTPSGETQTVAAGARVTYSATYVNDNGAEPIVVDHRAVLAFDAGQIPERWLDEVKNQGILIHIPGRSHAQQLVGDLDGDPVSHIGGLKTLEAADPSYAVAIACDLADLPASGALRILKGQYDPQSGEVIESWECRFDDVNYWARETGRTVTEFTATHAADQGSPITAPTDRGYSGNDHYLDSDGLRASIYNQDFRVAALTAGGYLFDQADIENWNADFTERRSVTHDGQDLQLRHTDWDGSDCAHGGMGLCVAKAIWWLAARLAGWDGTPALP